MESNGVMKFQAVVFDFDGVCIDTEQARFQSWQMIFESFGQELPKDEWIRNIGSAAWVSDPFIILETLVGKKLDRKVYEAMHRVNELEIANAMSLQPGLIDRLREAHAIGTRCAIASSSSHRWVDGHLERRGIRELFATTVCRGDTERHKPDPQPYQFACERLGIAPESALALEDSPAGITAARAAGLYTIAVPCSMTAGMDFSAAHCVVPSLEQVRFSDGENTADTTANLVFSLDETR